MASTVDNQLEMYHAVSADALQDAVNILMKTFAAGSLTPAQKQAIGTAVQRLNKVNAPVPVVLQRAALAA
jgi:hypothetical protein